VAALAGILANLSGPVDTSITSLLKEGWRRDRVEKPYTEETIIRASSLYSLCVREEVLRSVFKVDRLEKFGANTLINFSHGTGLHHVMQNEVLPAIGVLYGTWRCFRCGRLYGEVTDPSRWEDQVVRQPPEQCACTPGDFRADDRYLYVEASFNDPVVGLKGRPDGFLVLPGLPGMGILEVKSAGDGTAWRVRSVPDMGNVIQLHAYMLMTGAQWGQLVYWEKKVFGMPALIEHHVERDEGTIDRIKALIDRMRQGIREQSFAGVDRMCKTKSCARAKRCPVRAQCFEA